jgi:putative oxidoreductase
MIRWAFQTKDITALWLVRISVGTIFLSEGIQKFLFAESLGAGRFEKIGLPIPHILGPFVGSVEILFGTLVAVGFATRLSAIPLFIVISTAIATTKVTMFTEKGFWGTMHDSRTDFSMFMCLLFLIIIGGGMRSVDGFLEKRKGHRK